MLPGLDPSDMIRPFDKLRDLLIPQFVEPAES